MSQGFLIVDVNNYTQIDLLSNQNLKNEQKLDKVMYAFIVSCKVPDAASILDQQPNIESVHHCYLTEVYSGQRAYAHYLNLISAWTILLPL